MPDIYAHFAFVLSPDSRLQRRGEDFMKYLFKQSNCIGLLQSILTSSCEILYRTVAAQWLYRRLAIPIAKEQAQDLFNHCFHIEEPKLLIYRVIARLIVRYITPESISDLFAMGSKGNDILIELAMELTITRRVEVLVQRYSSQVFANCTDWEVLSQWTSLACHEDLLNPTLIQRAINDGEDDFLVDVAKQTASASLLPVLPILMNAQPDEDRMIAVIDIATAIMPTLTSVEHITPLCRWIIDLQTHCHHHLSILEHIISFWESLPIILDPQYVLYAAAIGSLSNSEAWSQCHDRDRCTELRRDVRDAIRANLQKCGSDHKTIIIQRFLHQLTKTSDLYELEWLLHGLSAMGKSLPSEGSEIIVSIVEYYLHTTPNRMVMLALCLLMHVWDALRGYSQCISFLLICLQFPHSDGSHLLFCSKQDHAAVVALTRCSLDVCHYQGLLQLDWNSIRNGLTTQSFEILLQTLVKNCKTVECVNILRQLQLIQD